MNLGQSELRSHSFFRSTSSARIRIAANLKDIRLKYVYVNLRQGAQLDESLGDINPNRTLPVLTITTDSMSSPIIVRQSTAILELFKEAFPDSKALLPPPHDVSERAKVRELVQIIASDVQPPTNQRILKRIKEYAGFAGMEHWARDIMGDGLAAFKKLVGPCAGRYCYGDAITKADVVLVPAVDNADPHSVDLANLPTIARISNNLPQIEAFKAGSWRHQGDNPEEERLG